MREIFSTWYIGISCQTRWLKQLRCQSTGNHRIHLSSNPRTESEPLWQSQKLAVITLPIPSMYGICTYIWFLLILLLSYCHYCHKYPATWWFQPIWKNMQKSNWKSSPENSKIMKPPPSFPGCGRSAIFVPAGHSKFVAGGLSTQTAIAQRIPKIFSRFGNEETYPTQTGNIEKS